MKIAILPLSLLALLFSLPAADGSWESFPDGSQGRTTEYPGNGVENLV